jgi:hypothetical protein
MSRQCKNFLKDLGVFFRSEFFISIEWQEAAVETLSLCSAYNFRNEDKF